MDSVNLVEGYKSANELTKQLITLAIGILAISITFRKEILPDTIRNVTIILKFSWLSYLLSVCLGMWAMMALTGMVFKASIQGAESMREDPYGSSFLPAFLQIISFLAGTVLIIWYGMKSLQSLPETDAEAPPASE